MQIERSFEPAKWAYQVVSLLEQNNKLYKAIVEASRQKVNEHNESALKANILLFAANRIKNSHHVQSEEQAQNQSVQQEITSHLSEHNILLESLIQHPFLIADTIFPHLNEGNHQNSGRESLFITHRITIRDDDIKQLKINSNLLRDYFVESHTDLSKILAFFVFLYKNCAELWEKMLKMLSNFTSSSDNNRPMEQYGDLAQNVASIVDKQDVTQKVKLIHEFNSQASPLISIIYDTTLIKTEEERLDLLTNLAGAKPYRLSDRDKQELNINIPGDPPDRRRYAYATSGFPLHHAVCSGSLKMVKVLLSQGADCNVKGTHIKSCIIGREISHEGLTPLHIAVANGDLEKVKLLCEYGADINAVNDKAQTPLHLVTHTAIFDFLVAQGANINQQDVNGQSPLHFAAKDGHIDIVEALLEKQEINANIQDKLGNTALHLVAAKKFDKNDYFGFDLSYKTKKQHNLEIMCTLLKKGANINQVNHRGYSPLHFAVIDNEGGIITQYPHYLPNLDYGHILNQVTILCENNGDVNCQTYKIPVKKNFWDIDYAKNHPAPQTTPILALYITSYPISEKGHVELTRIAEVLVKHGAKSDLIANPDLTGYEPGQTLLDPAITIKTQTL